MDEWKHYIRSISVPSDKKWIKSVKKCSYPTALTAELLNALIEKIVIQKSSTDDKDGAKCQKFEIYYRYIGKLD